MKRRRLKRPIRATLKAILYLILALAVDFVILYNTAERPEIMLPSLACIACIAANAILMYCIFNKRNRTQRCGSQKKERQYMKNVHFDYTII